MRKIKFRAWNAKMQRMFSAEEMTIDQMALLPNGYFANIDGQHTSRSVIYPHEAMLPLQYTGLTDKNGAEAYTDDIAEDEHGQRFVIEWSYPLLARLQGIPFTIIGNIHENPELLENKQQQAYDRPNN